jgi:hypothetical protein
MEAPEIQAFTQAVIKDVCKPRRHMLRTTFDKIFLEQQARNINSMNAYLVGVQAFFYGMKVMPISAISPGYYLTPLASDLQERHRDWYADFSVYQRDRQKFQQTMSSLFLRAKTWQDLRDMLPEHVIRPILPEIAALQGVHRLRPDLDTAINDQQTLHWEPRSMVMYQQISSLVNLYKGYALL